MSKSKIAATKNTDTFTIKDAHKELLIKCFGDTSPNKTDEAVSQIIQHMSEYYSVLQKHSKPAIVAWSQGLAICEHSMQLPSLLEDLDPMTNKLMTDAMLMINPIGAKKVHRKSATRQPVLRRYVSVAKYITLAACAAVETAASLVWESQATEDVAFLTLCTRVHDIWHKTTNAPLLSLEDHPLGIVMSGLDLELYPHVLHELVNWLESGELPVTIVDTRQVH